MKWWQTGAGSGASIAVHGDRSAVVYFTCGRWVVECNDGRADRPVCIIEMGAQIGVPMGQQEANAKAQAMAWLRQCEPTTLEDLLKSINA